MIPNRTNSRVAGSILRRLLPTPGSRNAVLAELATSIRFVDGLDSARWAVTLTSDMVRLNVGWVEAFAVFEGRAHVVCRHDQLPQQLIASGRIVPFYQPGGIYPRWAPESCSVEVPVEVAAALLPELRPAHEALIRDTVRSPMPASTRSAHSPGVIGWLSSALGCPLTPPSFALEATRHRGSAPARGRSR